MNGSGMEKEEGERRHHFKEKMSLEEAHHHRRPWIRVWRKKEARSESAMERSNESTKLIGVLVLCNWLRGPGPLRKGEGK